MHYFPGCAFGFGMFPVGQSRRRGGWQAPIFGRIDIFLGGQSKEWKGGTLAWALANGKLERRVPRKHRRIRWPPNTMAHPPPLSHRARAPQRPDAGRARWLGTCFAQSRRRSRSQVENQKRTKNRQGLVLGSVCGLLAFQEHGMGRAIISFLLSLSVFWCTRILDGRVHKGGGVWMVLSSSFPAFCS